MLSMLLIINPGSSSLKYKLFDSSFGVIKKDDVVLNDQVPDHKAAVAKVLEALSGDMGEIEKIGVRVVHGGPNFKEASPVSDVLLGEIKKYSTLAPLHNPPALLTIEALLDKFDQSKVYAVFDTGFFNSLPAESRVYPLGPVDTPLPIRRYGFHGISHKYMAESADPSKSKKIITVHLGAGSSISAVNGGQVVATSMGLTPDEGLIMQSRSGDLDPGLILYLASELGVDETKKLIEEESGLAGLTGTDGAMLTILALAGEEISEVDYVCPVAKTDELRDKSAFAIKLYVNKIVQYIGGYAALMNGLEVVAFSGKIGAGSPVIRDKVMSSLGFLGNVEVKVVEPDEELAMAMEIKDFRIMN